MVELGFDRFFYTYITILFFIVMIIGLGAGDIFSESVAGLEPPSPPIPNPEYPLLEFINSIGYFIANLGFFFTLMTTDTGVFLFGALIGSPAIVMIFKELLSMIRG